MGSVNQTHFRIWGNAQGEWPNPIQTQPNHTPNWHSNKNPPAPCLPDLSESESSHQSWILQLANEKLFT